IEHEKCRSRRKRARDLEHALLAVGQRARALIGSRAEADELEELARFRIEAAARRPHEVLPEGRVLMNVESGAHVLEQRELLEKADLLEGARDAQAHAAIRRLADEMRTSVAERPPIRLVD